MSYALHVEPVTKFATLTGSSVLLVYPGISVHYVPEICLTFEKIPISQDSDQSEKSTLTTD